MITPLGGQTYQAFWFDEFGAPCGADRAQTGEIVEYDADGVLLGRTYVDTRHDPEAVTGQESDPDDQVLYPENADLLKFGSWDIRTPSWDPVQTLQELLVFLDVADVGVREQRVRVAALMSLPAWTPAPAALKAEVQAWLARTVQE